MRQTNFDLYCPNCECPMILNTPSAINKYECMGCGNNFDKPTKIMRTKQGGGKE